MDERSASRPATQTEAWLAHLEQVIQAVDDTGFSETAARRVRVRVRAENLGDLALEISRLNRIANRIFYDVLEAAYGAPSPLRAVILPPARGFSFFRVVHASNGSVEFGLEPSEQAWDIAQEAREYQARFESDRFGRSTDQPSEQDPRGSDAAPRRRNRLVDVSVIITAVAATVSGAVQVADYVRGDRTTVVIVNEEPGGDTADQEEVEIRRAPYQLPENIELLDT